MKRALFWMTVVFLFLPFLSAALSEAAEEKTILLTLDDALKIAAEKNKDIQKAMEYRKKVFGRYLEERSAALPHLTGAGVFSKIKDDSQKNLKGTSDTNSVLAAINVEQTVFTWGKVDAAIRAAKEGISMADEQLRVFRQAALNDVSAAFYDVILAKELNLIARQNLEQKKRHSEETNKKFDAGIATEYDVLAAKVSVDNAKPDVVKTENLIRLSLDRLRFLLGIEDGKLDVKGSLDVFVTESPDFSAVLAAALEKRPELSEMRHRLKLYKELSIIADAGNKPRLDFKGSVGWSNIETDKADGAGTSWSAGLYLSVPFFDGFRTRGQAIQAGSDFQTIKIEEAKLIESINLESRRSLNNLNESAEIITALSGTVEQAEKLLSIVEKGYTYGVKTRLDVQDAQLNLLQTKGSLAMAKRNYLVALVELRRVMGILGE